MLWYLTIGFVFGPALLIGLVGVPVTVWRLRNEKRLESQVQIKGFNVCRNFVS